ncbi:MAG: ATPase [Ruminococcus sp.]|nr:ATPase [Ruminococcus sp.]
MDRLDKRVEDLILELQDMVNDAKGVPMSRDKKVIISGDRVFDILDEIEDNLPAEISVAKNIVADRDAIIEEAHRNADEIIRQAEERRKIMVSQHEVTLAAEAKSKEILNDAKKKSVEMHKAANSYVEDIMRRADESITSYAQEIRKARQNLKSSMK